MLWSWGKMSSLHSLGFMVARFDIGIGGIFFDALYNVWLSFPVLVLF
jgi:hypothetical protein